MSNFNSMSLPESILKALHRLEISIPTPIQTEAIPVGLARRDVLGIAQTGTGKTIAFAAPIITELLKHERKSALILVPTRELAVQVSAVIKDLTHFSHSISSSIVIGGMPMGPQIKSLSRKPRIIIATPGRLVDHLRRGHVSLRSCDIVVLDEADRMLDMGFSAQINEIFKFVPTVRQTLLFSATMQPEAEKLAAKHLRNPARIQVMPTVKPVKELTEAVLFMKATEKKNVLNVELARPGGSVIVFTRTKHRADRVCRDLAEKGHQVARIHGGRTQAQRQKALNDFREGRLRILVATDIASRGIDVPEVAQVINYDIPKCSDDYIHRVGRTARAGTKGKALSFVTPEEKRDWRHLTKAFDNTHSGGPSHV